MITIEKNSWLAIYTTDYLNKKMFKNINIHLGHNMNDNKYIFFFIFIIFLHLFFFQK